MSETFMQVGMQVVTSVAVFVYETDDCLVFYELLLEPVAMCSLIICSNKVAYGNAFASVSGSYPVRIR